MDKKTLKIILLLLIPVSIFSQNNIIEYCINDGITNITIKSFEELKISTITWTLYELNKKGVFHRTDKLLYTYNQTTGILTASYLKQNDKPYRNKNMSFYYKQDSLKNIYLINLDSMVYHNDKNTYIFDDSGRIKKDNYDNYFYDKEGKLIKIISDTMKYSMNTPVTITEYTYDNDTLKTELTYNTQYNNNNRGAGKLKEYIYQNGKIKGYQWSEKYYSKPKEPELHIFELIKNENTVLESVYINNKLVRYNKTKFGEEKLK